MALSDTDTSAVKLFAVETTDCLLTTFVHCDWPIMSLKALMILAGRSLLQNRFYGGVLTLNSLTAAYKALKSLLCHQTLSFTFWLIGIWIEAGRWTSCVCLGTCSCIHQMGTSLHVVHWHST